MPSKAIETVEVPPEIQAGTKDNLIQKEMLRESLKLHRSANANRRTNIAYMGVMTAALVVLSIVLLGYVRLQSSITLHVNNISQLESELNSLKLSNDEMYTKIMSNVDLEEIKRIAVNELGMKYAKEGQVVPYSSQGSDYVRQYSEIPSN